MTKNMKIWVQQCVQDYGIQVTNLTTSFKSGQVFCALLHKFHPEAIDYYSLQFTPENAEKNMDLAFKGATKYGVHQLLDAEDIVQYQDEKSIFAYLTMMHSKFVGGVGTSRLGGTPNVNPVSIPEATKPTPAKKDPFNRPPPFKSFPDQQVNPAVQQPSNFGQPAQPKPNTMNKPTVNQPNVHQQSKPTNAYQPPKPVNQPDNQPKPTNVYQPSLKPVNQPDNQPKRNAWPPQQPESNVYQPPKKKWPPEQPPESNVYQPQTPKKKWPPEQPPESNVSQPQPPIKKTWPPEQPPVKTEPKDTVIPVQTVTTVLNPKKAPSTPKVTEPIHTPSSQEREPLISSEPKSACCNCIIL